MSEVFFIGDTHFGHKGILNFSATKPFRPFDTIEEHDAELIKRWNSVVGKKDVVWHLGDFCFGKRNLPIAGELNGVKKLVLGNHDTYATEDYLKYFHKVYGAVEYKGAILTHIPVHESQFSRYYMNIHGHLHTNNLEDSRYFNVSAEQLNLTPIPYDEILNKWAENN
ncbi:MAG: hypothetical protein Unbinned5081contig1002_12 [Prokaryotic dsDNA virus sp.]|nr:MAG: hypothetical protein Unbinned5081contig1002_12 [Prokaryotic dsDNA virus sp.]|tara:strand:+ start:4108 stop:4608 length:501 start_codon:yes stop_codon:yes gene_type:complete